MIAGGIRRALPSRACALPPGIFAKAKMGAACLLIAGGAVAQEGRAIASLPDEDVAALLAGEGWGLARPAELNGWPGPAHVLENAEALGLSEDQVGSITAIRDAMRDRARALGAAYVETEAQLSLMFRAGAAEPEAMTALLQRSAGIMAALRATHLGAHIATTPLLTETQRARYGELRGSADAAFEDHPGHAGHGQ